MKWNNAKIGTKVQIYTHTLSFYKVLFPPTPYIIELKWNENVSLLCSPCAHVFIYLADLRIRRKVGSEKSGDGGGGSVGGVSGMKWYWHLLIKCCVHHAMACHSKNCTTVSYYSSYTFNNSASLFPFHPEIFFSPLAFILASSAGIFLLLSLILTEKE